MPEVFELVALVSIAAATSAAAKRIGLLAPILLVLVGIGVSFVPSAPTIELDPDVVLFGFLPPLLYVASSQASVPDFRANLRPILLLAVGLVIVTALCVGLVLHAVLPEMPLALAFALGAIVSPPDAIAATAVARNVGLPRRVVTILEGEGMLNDATALVMLRITIAAAIGQSVGGMDVLLDALAAIGGGLAVGALCAWGAAKLHRWTEDPLIDNTISLLTPFLAYAGAEQIEGSGVLAVVICGLYLGHRWTLLVSAAARLQMSAFWRLVEFLLESTLFLLVGLELREVFDGLSDPMDEVATATVAVVLVVLLIRFVWVYPAANYAKLVPGRRSGRAGTQTLVRVPTLIAWSGVRGALTLAAALTLPTTMDDGSPLPYRDLLIWLACAVIGVTLLLQGTTLSAVARRLRISPDDPQQDALAAAAVQHEATQAALARLDELAGDAPPEVVDQLRVYAERKANHAWERLGSSDGETPSHAYKRLRKQMLAAERTVFREARNDGRIPELVMAKAERQLDLEESLLTKRG